MSNNTARLTTSEREAVVKAYVDGESVSSICARLNRTPSPIFRLLRRHGVVRGIRVPNELAEEILAASRAGETLKSIAERMGKKPGTIQAFCASHEPRCRTRRKHSLQVDYFATITTEPQAYILGFHAADGCCRKYSWDIALAEKDHDILEKIKAEVGSEAPIRTRLKKGRWLNHRFIRGGQYSRLTVHSRQLCADLTTLGYGGRKVDRVRAWDGPPHLMPHFFRGALDGDGCYMIAGERQRCCHISIVGTEMMVTAYAEFIHTRLGFMPRVSRPRINLWTAVTANIPKCQAIVRLLYQDATIWLDRKKAIADRMLAIVPERGRWFYLTPDDLTNLKSQFGSWGRVAAHLGCTETHLYHQRRTRLGMPPDRSWLERGRN